MSSPRLTFTCPNTKRRVPTRISADAKGLQRSWRSCERISCPYCGKVHEISVRELFIKSALNVAVAPSQKPR
jgi:hypothetical protein